MAGNRITLLAEFQARILSLLSFGFLSVRFGQRRIRARNEMAFGRLKGNATGQALIEAMLGLSPS